MHTVLGFIVRTQKNTLSSFTCVIHVLKHSYRQNFTVPTDSMTPQQWPQTGAEGLLLQLKLDGDGEVNCTRATALLALHALRSAAVLQLFSSS
jgi:hypothetical protein